MRLIVSLICAVLIMFSPLAGADEVKTEFDKGVEGRYVGTINLSAKGISIPLEISLFWTELFGSYEGGNFDAELRGVFLVDDEAGPFAFDEVIFRLEDGVMDMKYRRPDGLRRNNVPADFRLVGKLQPGGKITGFARSGRSGVLGDFELELVQTGVQHLHRRMKYLGFWQTEQPISSAQSETVLTAIPKNWHATNPQGFDFAYTAGRFGVWGDRRARIYYEQAFIDYFKRTVNFVIVGGNTRSSHYANINCEIRTDGNLECITDAPLGGSGKSFIMNKFTHQ